MKNALLASLAVAATSIASFAYAAGSDSTEPPKPTETTTVCEEGQVWDEKAKACIKLKAGLMTDDQIYAAARELAYDGQYDHALNVLDVAADQNDPRILNYKGFANRKAGRVEEGMAFYQAALTIDPDYILARSYMGQGLIADGDIGGAWEQLTEIKARGGEGTWAYASLEKALAGEASDW
jgi:tetratricopeptide (TPR) repeat protein